MAAFPNFLARLELASDADERLVRRAYARELKKIDQERDLDGFQYLRTCYEAALAWVARRDAVVDEAGEPDKSGAQLHEAQVVQLERAPPPMGSSAAPPSRAYEPGATPRPEQPSALALGAAAFAVFQGRCAALAVQPEDGAPDDAQRTAPWTRALQDALADPRLENLDARLAFEHQVASKLADGWQPGHHLLLVAAVAVFGWNEDRHALVRLGYPGALLDKALEQREMFLDQIPQTCAQQRDALAKLRAPKLPPKRVIGQRIRALRMLQARFPVLLHVVAPQAAVEAWHQACPAAQGEALQDAALEPPARKKVNWGAIVFFAVIVVVGLLRYWSEPAQQGFYPPGDGIPGAGSKPVPQERIDAIRKRIEFKPGPHTLPGTQYAEVRVDVDANGAIKDIVSIPSGAAPEFVDAVIKAIRDSGPFAPGTASSFKLEFSVTVNRTPVKTATGEPRERGERGERGKRPEPVSMERLIMIRKRIDYRPGNDVLPGEQVVRMQVRLDWRQEVFNITNLTQQADPGLVKAIDKAIRASGAFPPGTPKVFSLEYKLTIPPKRPRAPAPRQDSASAPDTGAAGEPGPSR